MQERKTPATRLSNRACCNMPLPLLDKVQVATALSMAMASLSTDCHCHRGCSSTRDSSCLLLPLQQGNYLSDLTPNVRAACNLTLQPLIISIEQPSIPTVAISNMAQVFMYCDPKLGTPEQWHAYIISTTQPYACPSIHHQWITTSIISGSSTPQRRYSSVS
jgi:hypothetical protein